MKRARLTFAPRALITPDPDQARELEKKLAALAYRPANGFHRDLRQEKQRTR